MLKTFSSVLAIAALATLGSHAQAASTPNLSGTYRCTPDPDPCRWPGKTLSIAQSGDKLDLKDEQGSFGSAKLTSDISLTVAQPFNSLGRILPDHSIEWSNGTKWSKK
jgi:hypothetical protein